MFREWKAKESDGSLTTKHCIILQKALQKDNDVKEIKDKINDFLSNFNNYFNDHIFKRYTKHIENLINEKYKKHLEICNYYDGQIKEMDFIMAGKLRN